MMAVQGSLGGESNGAVGGHTAHRRRSRVEGGRGGLGRSVSLRFPADRVCPDVAEAVEQLFWGSEIVAFQKLIEIRHQQNQ